MSGAWKPEILKEKWMSSGGKWWYRHSDGSYTALNWKKIDGKWYYFDASGWMVTGWQKVGDNWYYLYDDGWRFLWCSIMMALWHLTLGLEIII